MRLIITAITVHSTSIRPNGVSDKDGDGFQSVTCNADRTRGGGDCNDDDPLVNPSRMEIRGNGKDDDCAGGDVGCLQNCMDMDLDGFGQGAGCYGPAATTMEQSTHGLQRFAEIISIKTVIKEIVRATWAVHSITIGMTDKDPAV